MWILLIADSAVNFVGACYCLNFVALIDAILCRRFLCQIESWRRQLSRWIWTGRRARKCCRWGGFPCRMLRPLYSSVGLMALCIFRAWWRRHRWRAQCSTTWFSAGGCEFTCLMKTSRPSRRAAMPLAQHRCVMKSRFYASKIACCVTRWRIKRGCRKRCCRDWSRRWQGDRGRRLQHCRRLRSCVRAGRLVVRICSLGVHHLQPPGWTWGTSRWCGTTWNSRGRLQHSVGWRTHFWLRWKCVHYWMSPCQVMGMYRRASLGWATRLLLNSRSNRVLEWWEMWPR